MRALERLGVLRWFITEEYGSELGRLHYHAILVCLEGVVERELRGHWSKRNGSALASLVKDREGQVAYVGKYTSKDLNGGVVIGADGRARYTSVEAPWFMMGGTNEPERAERFIPYTVSRREWSGDRGSENPERAVVRRETERERESGRERGVVAMARYLGWAPGAVRSDPRAAAGEVLRRAEFDGESWRVDGDLVGESERELMALMGA